MKKLWQLNIFASACEAVGVLVAFLVFGGSLDTFAFGALSASAIVVIGSLVLASAQGVCIALASALATAPLLLPREVDDATTALLIVMSVGSALAAALFAALAARHDGSRSSLSSLFAASLPFGIGILCGGIVVYLRSKEA